MSLLPSIRGRRASSTGASDGTPEEIRSFCPLNYDEIRLYVSSFIRNPFMLLRAICTIGFWAEELSRLPKAWLLLACLKKELFTKERRGLLIGSGRIPEPSIPRNSYTTEGKASSLLCHPLYFQNLQWTPRAHRALCSGSCRTFYRVFSHSCLS